MSEVYQSSDSTPPPEAATATPSAIVEQNPSVGVSAKYAREDHEHQGLAWIRRFLGDPKKNGGIQIKDTASVTWTVTEWTGGEHYLELQATAVGSSPADAAPPSVGSTSVLGSSTQYSREDHTHAGVSSLDAGSGAITGAVTLAAGTGVSLAQTASTVTISSTGVSSIDAGSGALTGPINLAAGSNVSISQSGSTITINSSASGGGGSSSWSERTWSAVGWTANITLDTSSATGFAIIMGGNTTLQTPTGGAAYKSIVVRLTQDATGSRTLSFSGGWNISNDLLGLTVSSAASSTSYIGAIYNEQTLKWDVVSFARGY